MTYRRPTSYAQAAQQLDMLDIEAHIEVSVEGFLPVPMLIAGTDRIALLQERLARSLLPLGGFTIRDCPFQPAPLIEGFWWHPTHRHDAGHTWLRRFLAEVGRRIDGDEGAGAPGSGGLARLDECAGGVGDE